MQYQTLRSVSDNHVFVICYDGRFDELPDHVRHQGPWQGMHRGEIEKLKANSAGHSRATAMRSRSASSLCSSRSYEFCFRTLDHAGFVRAYPLDDKGLSTRWEPTVLFQAKINGLSGCAEAPALEFASARICIPLVAFRWRCLRGRRCEQRRSPAARLCKLASIPKCVREPLHVAWCIR